MQKKVFVRIYFSPLSLFKLCYMNSLLTILLFIPFFPALGVCKLYDPYPVYKGNDLGLRYTKTEARFRIWSPPAEAAEILLYKAGSDQSPFKTAELKKGKTGDWSIRLTGDWKGTFYTFRVK